MQIYATDLMWNSCPKLCEHFLVSGHSGGNRLRSFGGFYAFLHVMKVNSLYISVYLFYQVNVLQFKVYQISCVGIIFSCPYGVSNFLKYQLWPYLTTFHIVTMAADKKHAIQGVPWYDVNAFPLTKLFLLQSHVHHVLTAGSYCSCCIHEKRRRYLLLGSH